MQEAQIKPQTNKLVNLEDLMSPEDAARVEAAARERDAKKAALITREWLGLSELGYYYGWSAVQDVMNDVITLEQANMLVEGARKIHSGQVYDTAIAVRAGTVGNTKKEKVFDSLMKHYISDMEAVN